MQIGEFIDDEISVKYDDLILKCIIQVFNAIKYLEK